MIYEVIIIGGGPAGLSAAVYAARYKINFAIVAPMWGGFVNEAHSVENWLGDKSISGQDLVNRFLDHVKSLKSPMITANVQAIEKTKSGFEIITHDNRYKAKKVILALGTERNKLGINGEEEFLGKGVSYCATCDGFFFRDKTVAVVGSGDAACTGATFLSDVAKKVYLIYRSPSLKAEPIWIDKVNTTDNIECLPDTRLKEIAGKDKVEKIVFEDNTELAVDGVFIEVGSTPTNFITQRLGLEVDNKGYIAVDSDQKTSIEGIYAAGDITTNSSKFKQIIVAASEGAVAVYNAYIDLKK
ncbi:MAG: FAD-dependent oxidoreductase [Patescibacteria group bacterium]|jgi:thioredoxin reductase (NADPH)|nr:FAD-dependent oxidoreductase [Patescibacteria group bacterium]